MLSQHIECTAHCSMMLFPVLDFGVDHLAEVAKEMAFPWLMSNARLHTTGRRLADGHEKLILNWRGRKVRSFLP